jgi:hypothetical protein
MRLMRRLFELLHLDVTAFSDEAIADAVLHVCPMMDEGWPTDAQLLAVFAHLQATKS